MTKPYDVSVLIPAWNAEHTLARAIRSALNQAEIKVQVIVCDNGSTDATYNEAKRVQDDERSRSIGSVGNVSEITLIKFDVNQGFTGACNACGERAQGAMMIVLGADDWFEPNALTKMVKILQARPGIDFVYGCMKYWGRRSDVYVPPVFKADDFYDRNASNYAVLFHCEVWARGIRFGSEIEPSVGVPDWDFVLQMIESGSHGLALQDVLVLNWIFAHGSNTDKTWAKQAESLEVFKRRHPKVRATSI